MDEVAKALTTHLEVVRRTLANGARSPAHSMLESCDAAESGTSFRALASACMASIIVPKGRLYSSPVKIGTWESALSAFFRRSGIYASINDTHLPNPEAVLQKLRSEVARPTCTLKHMLLLDNMDLGKRNLDWKTFQLCWLDEKGLKASVDFDTRRLFYPHTLEGVSRFQCHYFLVVEEVVETGINGSLRNLGEMLSSSIPIRPTTLPKVVEKALRALVLHDWQPFWHEQDQRTPAEKQIGWSSFGIPALISVKKDLLCPHYPLPHSADIVMEPFLDNEGEEIGEVPQRPVLLLDDTAIEKLNMDIAQAIEAMKHLDGNQDAQFVQNSLDFLLKAFLSEGAEQILWHVVAIEAALGPEKDAGPIMQTIRRRAAAILGGSDSERKAVRNQVRDLYDFRSSLVHGEPQRESVFRGHCATARRLSRSVVVWTLRAFAFLTVKGKSTPTLRPIRSDLLRLTDLAEEERIRIGAQLSWLPKDFPRVSDWIG